MSSKTTNYNLHKIDLIDAPPDITMLNPNWDIIDSELKARLPLTGGTITGNLDLKLVDGNGICGLYKNHSATNDFGFYLVDQSEDGKYAKLRIDANHNELAFYPNDNLRYSLYGEHNVALLKQQLSAVATATVG